MGRKTNFISDDIATTVVPTTPANPQVGEPCGIGDIPGVVVEPPAADGSAVVRLRGVFRLPVTGVDENGGAAVNTGDEIWFHSASEDEPLSKDTGGNIKFGVALEEVPIGDTKDVLVLLRGAQTPPIPPTNPTVPTGFAQGSSVTDSATQIRIEWVRPVGDFGDNNILYDVRWKLTSDSDWTEPATLQGTRGRFARISSLTASTSYDFAVRAGNRAGKSGWTATLTASTTA